MQTGKSLLFAAAIAVSVANIATAGGFMLQVGNPNASAEAQAMKAFITVKTVGCHDPSNAELSAAAIGMKDGKRERIPVRVRRLSPGMFAVARQWPAEGQWTLEFVARHRTSGIVASALVNAAPEGFDRGSVKLIPGEPSPDAIDQMIAKR